LRYCMNPSRSRSNKSSVVPAQLPVQGSLCSHRHRLLTIMVTVCKS
jgi:hypothetical protein